MKVPVLSRDAIREVDRCAIQQYQIPGIVLMENAGRGCVDVLCRVGIEGPVVICCGRGNNAGDGLVMARHLDLRGHDVQLLFWSDPGDLTGDAGMNYQIACHGALPMHVFEHGEGDRVEDHDGPAVVDLEGEDVEDEELHAAALGTLMAYLQQADWIVDALLGTGARGVPRTPLDRVIDQLNTSPAKKMAIDVPSGLDCESGTATQHCFRADHTCTFVAAKPGLVMPAAREWVGQLHVLDIGTPRRLLRQFGLEV